LRGKTEQERADGEQPFHSGDDMRAPPGNRKVRSRDRLLP
jgi:hypothetical protein